MSDAMTTETAVRPGRMALIERYRELLPVTPRTPVISLHEGGTPLLRARGLEAHLDALAGRALGLRVFLKYDGTNPTGSFKDRGMTVAISKAMEAGARGVICASTGNTSASAAAYAARARIPCYVVIPDGHIAMGKLAQAVMAGAKVIAIRGNFDRALELVREAAEKLSITLVNSVNPHRIDGQKTAAWEIVDELGEAPRFHCIPVGNAGNITAHWLGYREYASRGRAASLPRMMGFQAEGAAPIVRGAPVKEPETLATAIRIGNPASWEGAVRARDESGGRIGMVTDDEIVSAYKLIASLEGVFAEPASAASVAGLIRTVTERDVPLEGTVVCTLTGHGLKDPERAIRSSPPPRVVDASIDALGKELSS